jgi:hypothetical protein
MLGLRPSAPARVAAAPTPQPMTRHAVVLTDPVALVVGDAVLILVEVVLDAARDGDQQ